MRQHTRVLLLRLVLASAMAVASGCDANSSSYAPAVSLPTLGQATGCAGFGIVATLHGDPTYPGITWLEADGSRLDVYWPPGYRARFTPDLIVIDDHGTVVLREGSSVSEGCSVEQPEAVRLSPPFGR